MNYRVRHVTEYAYGGRVELAAHLLRLRPRDLPWQTVQEFRLSTSPAATMTWSDDHFGNRVAALLLDEPHTRFAVTADMMVEVRRPRALPDPAGTLAWERVVAMVQGAAAARDAAEFVFGSPLAPASQAAAGWARPSFPPARPILAGLLDLNARIHRDFRFDPEATGVSTPVERVLQLGAGVCQDFAHLMIAALRALRLPARYVSGYIRTVPAPGAARMCGADQSHAWVSCWLGPEDGWIDLDPTNNLVVADEHVWLGWGRDYADVSPIHGVLLGGGHHTLAVSVDMAPVLEPQRAA